MPVIHFLNVYEGDCNIIEHGPYHGNRVTVIDVSNADNGVDTQAEQALKASQARAEMRTRNYVPDGKINYGQKRLPDNPIEYLKKRNINSIFRFIITHPDMDHLDGVKDFFDSFTITNTWDTDNNKTMPAGSSFGPYNKEDWDFYTDIRDGRYKGTGRHTFFEHNAVAYFTEDNINILCPSPELVTQANDEEEYHHLSYVALYTPPKRGGGTWKFLFAGDSHDVSWELILEKYKEEISNIDVLFAPHHGRDSGRNYDFLKVLNPKVTLMGNASSEHLAYDKYPPIRITNNQAGYVVLDITEDCFVIGVKNEAFATNFTRERSWPDPSNDWNLDAYPIIQFNA